MTPSIHHDHPHELEARLEPRERATPNGVGTVALQEAVEPEPARRRFEGDRHRRQVNPRYRPRTAPSSPEDCGSDKDDGTITSSSN